MARFRALMTLPLLLLLVSAAPAAATINLVTSGSGAGVNIGANPYNVTVNLNTGDNNTVVVVVATKGNSISAVTVQDSGGSVYVKLTDSGTTSASARIQLWSTMAGASKNSTWVRANVNCCTGVDTVVAVASYSGVVSLGLAATSTMSGTTLSISRTTLDAYNWVVAGFAAAGSSDFTQVAPTIKRSSAVTSNTTTGGALSDTPGAATPGSVTNSVSVTSSEAAAMAAVELRTVPGITLLGTSSNGHSSSTCTMTNIPAAGIDLPGKVNVVVVTFAATGSSEIGRAHV